jgi:hypothetical protein
MRSLDNLQKQIQEHNHILRKPVVSEHPVYNTQYIAGFIDLFPIQ